MAKILVVEDDPVLAENICEWLKLEHHVVETISNGTDALDRLRFYQYELIILDWMLPGLVGVEVCKRFRAAGGRTPVLLLTGKKEISEKEQGLDAGADDYLTKPFHMRELTARLRALLRRPPMAANNILRCGPIELNVQDHSVRKNGKEITLLPKEYALLEFLLRHPNEVFSAEALLDRVWQSTSEISPESIRTYVARLRAKIDDKGEETMLQNMHGVGYRLNCK